MFAKATFLFSNLKTMDSHPETDAEGKISKSKATTSKWKKRDTPAMTWTRTRTTAMETRDENEGDDEGSKKKHAKDREAMLECALTRRCNDLDGLTRAFEEALTSGKRPFGPPICDGLSAQRAWLHSSDVIEYRDLLEEMIDKAECKLEKLEERL